MEIINRSRNQSFCFNHNPHPSTDFRVSFLIGGTQKGGTTTLDACLRLHPALCLGLRKELHYFDNEEHFSGIPDYSIYHRNFDYRHFQNKPLTLLGEATPIYMWWKPAAARIKDYKALCRFQWNLTSTKGRDRFQSESL